MYIEQPYLGYDTENPKKLKRNGNFSSPFRFESATFGSATDNIAHRARPPTDPTVLGSNLGGSNNFFVLFYDKIANGEKENSPFSTDDYFIVKKILTWRQIRITGDLIQSVTTPPAKLDVIVSNLGRRQKFLQFFCFRNYDFVWSIVLIVLFQLQYALLV